MNGSPMHRNFGIGDQDKKAARKEKRAQRRRDRLAKKGKLVSSERLTRFGDSDTYFIEDDDQRIIATDPKGVVINPTGGSSTQYKVSRKGKIKKEV